MSSETQNLHQLYEAEKDPSGGECASTGRVGPSWISSKTSSKTTNLEQPSQAEKLCGKSCEREVTRVEADIKQANEQAIDQVGAQARKPDNLEAALELKDKQLQAKDVTVQELQIAIDEVDRSAYSGDDKIAKDLQTTIECLKGDKIRVINFAKTTRINLTEAKGKMSLNETLVEQFTLIKVQMRKLHDLLTECEEALTLWREIHSERQAFYSSMPEYISSIQLQARVANSTLAGAIAEVGKFLDTAREKKAARYVPKPDPVTKDVELQPSRGASTSAPASQKFAKVRKSPSELEVLRLKDRRTLHSLAPR